MDPHQRELVRGNTETLLLALLADKQKHGYQLRRELTDLSHGYFRVSFGRLYPLLDQMEKQGLVKSRWHRGGTERWRKLYKISAAGHRRLKDLKSEWRRFEIAMSLVLDRAS